MPSEVPGAAMVIWLTCLTLPSSSFFPFLRSFWGFVVLIVLFFGLDRGRGGSDFGPIDSTQCIEEKTEQSIINQILDGETSGQGGEPTLS